MNRSLFTKAFSVAALVAAAVVALVPSVALADGPFSFYAVTPCRVYDTRVDGGGVPLAGAATRNFTVKNVCGVPADAKAVALNVTVTGPTTDGYLSLWPAGGAQPVVSTINFVTGEPALANGAIVPLAVATPDLSIYYGVGVAGSWSVHVILDVTGYFK